MQRNVLRLQDFSWVDVLRVCVQKVNLDQCIQQNVFVDCSKKRNRFTNIKINLYYFKTIQIFWKNGHIQIGTRWWGMAGVKAARHQILTIWADLSYWKQNTFKLIKFQAIQIIRDTFLTYFRLPYLTLLFSFSRLQAYSRLSTAQNDTLVNHLSSPCVILWRFRDPPLRLGWNATRKTISAC